MNHLVVNCWLFSDNSRMQLIINLKCNGLWMVSGSWLKAHGVWLVAKGSRPGPGARGARWARIWAARPNPRPEPWAMGSHEPLSINSRLNNKLIKALPVVFAVASAGLVSGTSAFGVLERKNMKSQRTRWKMAEICLTKLFVTFRTHFKCTNKTWVSQYLYVRTDALGKYELVD